MKCIVFIVMIASAAGVVAEKDTMPVEQRIARLEKRIDSLEVALARLAIKKDDDNPLMTARYLEWGRGFSIQATASLYSGLEAGYTFVTVRYFRLGISGGTGFLMTDVGYEGYPSMLLFGKTTLGTPIFLNFISFSGYLKMIYHAPVTIPQCGAKGNGGSSEEFGFDLEFWFSRHVCVLAGAAVSSGQIVGEKNPQLLAGTEEYSRFDLAFKYAFGTGDRNKKK